MLKLAKKIKLIFQIAFLFVVNACNSNSTNKNSASIPNFDWLVGNWINNQDTAALFFENWTKDSQENYLGKSFIISHNDTVFFESIQLHISDTGTYYSVSVNNQNNAETVHFKMVSNVNHTFKFENKKHDFPQSINYQFKAPDTLNAWISGIINGKVRKESFLMWRVH
jgi:uncharacterized protein YutD